MALALNVSLLICSSRVIPSCVGVKKVEFVLWEAEVKVRFSLAAQMDDSQSRSTIYIHFDRTNTFARQKFKQSLIHDQGTVYIFNKHILKDAPVTSAITDLLL